MDATLNALGGILLRALPTFFLVLVLHFYVKKMFFQPLEKVLAERRAATEGAREAAEAGFAKAAKLAADYEQALRVARADIAREREELRKKLLEEQAHAIAEAKVSLRTEIEEAQRQIAQEAETARAVLRAESERLASRIVERMVIGRVA